MQLQKDLLVEDTRCKNCKKAKSIVNKHFGLCLECNNLRLYGSKFGKVYKKIEKKRTPFRTVKKQQEIEKKAKNKMSYHIDFGRGSDTSITHTVVIGGRRAGRTAAVAIILDEQFYEECFNSFSHKCEECGTSQPEEFQDHDDKVIARWRYSHVIPKSIAPHLRHILNNINDLCLECHTKWDFGDKKSMKIYEKNSKRFPQYF